LKDFSSPSHSTKNKNSNFDSFGAAALSVKAQNSDHGAGDDFKRSVSFSGI